MAGGSARKRAGTACAAGRAARPDAALGGPECRPCSSNPLRKRFLQALSEGVPAGEALAAPLRGAGALRAPRAREPLARYALPGAPTEGFMAG